MIKLQLVKHGRQNWGLQASSHKIKYANESDDLEIVWSYKQLKLEDEQSLKGRDCHVCKSILKETKYIPTWSILLAKKELGEDRAALMVSLRQRDRERRYT